MSQGDTPTMSRGDTPAMSQSQHNARARLFLSMVANPTLYVRLFRTNMD